MSLAKLYWAILAACLTGALAVSGFTWHSYREVEATRQEANRATEAVREFLGLARNIVQIQQFTTDASLVGETAPLEEARSNKQEAQARLDRLQHLTNSSELPALRKGVDDLFAVGLDMYQAYQRGGRAEGNPVMERLDTASASLDGLARGEGERLEKLRQASVEKESSAIAELETLSMVLVLLLGTVAVAFVTLLKQQVMRPVQALDEQIAGLLGGHGDLTARLPATRQDEFGTLARKFNTLLDNWLVMMRELAAANGELLDTASGLEKQAKSSLNSAVTQASATEQVAVGANQLEESVREIVDLSQEAAHCAGTARQDAERGREAAEKATGRMGQLEQSVQQTRDVIERLAEGSQQVTSVLDVIRALADQTNLLALNAAIEAARAGELGRGFAVVADEVRVLATRTHQSTAEIDQIVGKLAHATREAVNAMGENQQLTREAVSLVEHVDRDLGDILAKVQLIAEHSGNVARAVDQQKQAIALTHHKVVDIASIAEANVIEARTLTTHSDRMAALAAQISAYVKQYRL